MYLIPSCNIHRPPLSPFQVPLLNSLTDSDSNSGLTLDRLDYFGNGRGQEAWEAWDLGGMLGMALVARTEGVE